MLIRILFMLLPIQVVACQKVKNSISTVRLDCGQEASWEKPYLKFVDGVGNPLVASMLGYRSLEDESAQDLKLSSKGCVASEKGGLWLIHHREKPEGLIVDFSKISESTALQLRDISHENMQPNCPVYETGSVLDLKSILDDHSKHDLRGYEITFSFRSDRFQKAWPRQNFSFLQPIQLAGVFPEGFVDIDLTVTNSFKNGEQTNKSCRVKFDYTGPIIESSLHQGQAKTYKGRPFISISSDLDVRFTSPADDFSSFEVCYQARPDWNTGENIQGFNPLCDKPEHIQKDRPIPFSVRKGFWQIQYRGIDPAGNTSNWSPPLTILFEQQFDRQMIVNKANTQASELTARSYAATPKAMLAALEIYNDWKKFPTTFEQEHMEDSILLTLHRPWMEPSIQVNLRVAPYNRFPAVAFPLLGGKKFITIEKAFQSNDAWHFEVTLTDVETLIEKKLPAPEILPEGWQVSTDGTRFFWYNRDYVYYGKLEGDEVKFQTLDYVDGYIHSVRFIDNDTQIVVMSDPTELTYFSTENELKEIKKETYPIDVHSSNAVESFVPIAYDARAILMEDNENNTLSYWSLFEENLRTPIDFRPELVPQFMVSVDGIKVLDTDKRFYISLTYGNLPYCSYYFYNAELPDWEKAKMMLEAMPCDKPGKGTPLGNDVWRSGPVDMSAVVYKPGSAVFRKPVMKPETPADLIQGSSLNRYITDSGNWMFSGSMQIQESGDSKGHIQALKRNEKGDFELAGEIWTCDGASEPYGFQFDEVNQVLYHVCSNYEGILSAWNMAVTPPQLISTLEVEETLRTVLLLNGQLLLGGTKGLVHVYDIHGNQQPTFSKSIKLGQHLIAKLVYDKVKKLLYSTEGYGTNPIKSWDVANFGNPINEISTRLKQLLETRVSIDGKYLAALAMGNASVFIWNTETKLPIYYREHTGSISDINFLGNSSILASGADNGVLKLWDVKNPDMPSVTFSPGLSKNIKNIASVPNSNEFIVETNSSRVFHYRLDSFDAILRRTCDALRPYLHSARDTYPEQAAFCGFLQSRRD